MKKIMFLLSTLLLAGCENEEQPTEETTPAPTKETIEETTNLASEESNVEELAEDAHAEIQEVESDEMVLSYDKLKAQIIDQYSQRQPVSWGEHVEGVITSIDTSDPIVALTFDACDGSPDSFDRELITFLNEENISATLFIGGQWIDAYQEEFKALAENPLFEIANHGYLHKPLSVNGEVAYGIPGTANVGEVFDEIYHNQIQIEALSGERPQYFRSGTAYYDEVAVEIAHELGLKVVNYNALGDAGGTFTHGQIVDSLSEAQAGSIYLFHMNQPAGNIASGVQEGVRALKDRGFNFVTLSEYDAQLR